VEIHNANNSLRKRKSPQTKGYTLLEITLVIGIVVGLSALAAVGLGAAQGVARASRAEAALRMVETARLSYLSDNPHVMRKDVSQDKLDKYIPGGFAAAADIVAENGYTIISIDQPRIQYRPTNPSSFDLKGFEKK